MHIVVVKQGQDHLELPSGVGTKHEQQKPIKVRQRRGQDWPYLVVYYLQVLRNGCKWGWGHDRPIVAPFSALNKQRTSRKAAQYPLNSQYFTIIVCFLVINA